MGPGFETEQLITFTVNPGNEGYSPAEGKSVLAEVQRVTGEVTGVVGVGVAAWPLLDGGGWGNPMLVEGRERLVTDVSLPMNSVSPGFFELLGVPLLAGRDFDSRDQTEGDQWSWTTAIVSQAFVDRYLPNQNPLGVRIDFWGDPSVAARMEIVGVVGDYGEQQLRDIRPQVYFPMWSQAQGRGVFYLKTRRPMAEVGPEIRAGIATVAPSMTVNNLRTLDQQLDQLLVFERMMATLGSAFALLGTVLAMIGVYGVLSFTARSRTREVGIRMALGAQRATASGIIFKEGLRLSAVGVLIALPVIWFLGRLIETQLFGVSAADPVSIGVGVGTLLIVCLVASLIPAWRVSRTSPLEAFKVE